MGLTFNETEIGSDITFNGTSLQTISVNNTDTWNSKLKIPKTPISVYRSGIDSSGKLHIFDTSGSHYRLDGSTWTSLTSFNCGGIVGDLAFSRNLTKTYNAYCTFTSQMRDIPMQGGGRHTISYWQLTSVNYINNVYTVNCYNINSNTSYSQSINSSATSISADNVKSMYNSILYQGINASYPYVSISPSGLSTPTSPGQTGYGYIGIDYLTARYQGNTTSETADGETSFSRLSMTPCIVKLSSSSSGMGMKYYLRADGSEITGENNTIQVSSIAVYFNVYNSSSSKVYNCTDMSLYPNNTNYLNYSIIYSIYSINMDYNITLSSENYNDKPWVYKYCHSHYANYNSCYDMTAVENDVYNRYFSGTPSTYDLYFGGAYRNGGSAPTNAFLVKYGDYLYTNNGYRRLASVSSNYYNSYSVWNNKPSKIPTNAVVMKNCLVMFFSDNTTGVWDGTEWTYYTA